MACAYEPAIENARAWAPPSVDDGPEVCPGYTFELPMAHEIVAALPHWEHGTLHDLVGGPAPRELLDGLAALQSGMRDRDRAELAARTKGGA